MNQVANQHESNSIQSLDPRNVSSVSSLIVGNIDRRIPVKQVQCRTDSSRKQCAENQVNQARSELCEPYVAVVSLYNSGIAHSLRNGGAIAFSSQD